jgi:hypothetical protein
MFTCERDAEALAENFWAEARKILEQNNPSNERIAQSCATSHSTGSTNSRPATCGGRSDGTT